MEHFSLSCVSQEHFVSGCLTQVNFPGLKVQRKKSSARDFTGNPVGLSEKLREGPSVTERQVTFKVSVKFRKKNVINAN